ncbi:GyrI-like domain-containing protein [Mucilaginibacter sp.]
MKTEIIDQDGFYIVGIAVRTTNQNGQSKKDIDDLWFKFMDDNLIKHIPNRESNDVYCVYTNYETDHTGKYTAILGCKVNSLANISNRFTAVSISAGKYQVYSLKNKLSEVISAAWQHIWTSDINRKYTYDYDLYSSDAENGMKISLAIN